MTTEGSQQTTPQSVARQPMGRQQLIIALVVIVAVIAGIAVWLTHGHTKKHKGGNGGNNTFSVIGPKTMSRTGLIAQSLAVGQPVYWAGPMPGMHYEFWRLKDDRIYVRYLPKGLSTKQAKGRKYLIIGTYPFPHAYKRLKKLAKGRGTTGPGGSFVWVRPGVPTSVYVVWPNVPYEVEVYNPRAAKAAEIAESGQVKTVG